jgi:hypothetical protein
MRSIKIHYRESLNDESYKSQQLNTGSHKTRVPLPKGCFSENAESYKDQQSNAWEALNAES